MESQFHDIVLLSITIEMGIFPLQSQSGAHRSWNRDLIHKELCHAHRVEKAELFIRGAVVAQWIRPQTLNREVPGSNLQAAADVLLGNALHPHCLVPQKGLKAIGPLVKAACFLSGQVK